MAEEELVTLSDSHLAKLKTYTKQESKGWTELPQEVIALVYSYMV